MYRKIVSDLTYDLQEAMNTWGNFSLHSFYHGEEQGEARGRIMSKMVCLKMLCDALRATQDLLQPTTVASYQGPEPGRSTPMLCTRLVAWRA